MFSFADSAWHWKNQSPMRWPTFGFASVAAGFVSCAVAGKVLNAIARPRRAAANIFIIFSCQKYGLDANRVGLA